MDYLTAEEKQAYRNGFAYSYGVKAEYGVSAMLRRAREAANIARDAVRLAFAAGAIDSALLIVCKAHDSEMPAEMS